MDGIATGERMWMARGRTVVPEADGWRRSIPRALRETDGGTPGRVEGERRWIRRVGAWFVRGWTAFAEAVGEPYLSLAGRQGAELVKRGDAGQEEVD